MYNQLRHYDARGSASDQCFSWPSRASRLSRTSACGNRQTRIIAIGLAILIGTAAHGQSPGTAQLGGSKLTLEQNGCATCHGEKDLWEGENARLYVPLEPLADDAHFKNGVNCHDCHGGNPGTTNFKLAHSVEVDGSQPYATPFRAPLVQKSRTAERLQMVTQLCGKCHIDAEKTFAVSVHGQGWQQSGLVVSPVCTDCHGHHSLFRTADARSPLNSANVGATCGKCHRFIQDRLEKSVHGLAASVATTTNRQQPGEKVSRKPNCIDCHQGHDLPRPTSAAFRAQLPERCGTCHAELTNTYTQSLHGELTDLGFVPAAKCSDCHGAHDILPIADAASRLSAANRQATCAKCHPEATGNFLDYDPHANPHDKTTSPLLYWINTGLTGMLIAVFAIFGLHSVLWCLRSLPHVARHGRPAYPTPGALAYRRFAPVHRIAHAVLMISFLGLALTGLPLEFSDYAWARGVSRLLGGFASTGLWHRIFGILNIGCLVFYLFYFSWRILVGPESGISRLQFIFGPDSPVPQPRDFSDFTKMLRWFVGLGPRPTFERWSYWEKFDLWAASCDIVLIGTTGLILWFPHQFCAVLPGIALNIADLIHGKLALLATGFVFSIHFFSSNLRPEKFPMDVSILTGLVSEAELEEERPEYMRRLKESGLLQRHLVETPSRGIMLLHLLGGAIALSLGLALLAAIVVALFL